MRWGFDKRLFLAAAVLAGAFAIFDGSLAAAVVCVACLFFYWRS